MKFVWRFVSTAIVVLVIITVWLEVSKKLCRKHQRMIEHSLKMSKEFRRSFHYMVERSQIIAKKSWRTPLYIVEPSRKFTEESWRTHLYTIEPSKKFTEESWRNPLYELSPFKKFTEEYWRTSLYPIEPAKQLTEESWRNPLYPIEPSKNFTEEFSRNPLHPIEPSKKFTEESLRNPLYPIEPSKNFTEESWRNPVYTIEPSKQFTEESWRNPPYVMDPSQKFTEGFWRNTLSVIETSKEMTKQIALVVSSETISPQKPNPVPGEWDMWEKMVTFDAVTSDNETVEVLLRVMGNTSVVYAGTGKGGTQLKAFLRLSGNPPQDAVFKPKRYKRTFVVFKEMPLAGFDRHNGEVAAFYLDRILSFNRAPPVIGRIINFDTEVAPVASEELRKTFIKDDNGNSCFYGTCEFCREDWLACGVGSQLEGALSLWLPARWKLLKKLNPWQQAYAVPSRLIESSWRYNATVCQNILGDVWYKERLGEIVDTAIFDFLIGNADRHDFEYLSDGTTSGVIVLLDNAKSFGNPKSDFHGILASLTQCCRFRRSTYSRLVSLTDDGKSLGDTLKAFSAKDPIAPLLSNQQFSALDRRALDVVGKMKVCLQKHGEDVFVYEG